MKLRFVLYGLAMAINCLLITGCREQSAKDPLPSVYVGHLAADKHLPYYIHIVEYNGRQYMTTSNGGLVLVPAE